MAEQIPISEDLFTWPSDEPHLIGGRNKETGKIVFPLPHGKMGERFERVELKNKGTLWTWTIQGFLPKVPYAGPETLETFKPYGVGYIELEGEVKVESRLTVSTPEELKIGMPMKLVIEKFNTDENGNDIMTYAFAPDE